MTTAVGNLTISPDVERALATIKRGSDELLIEAEFAQKLARLGAAAVVLEGRSPEPLVLGIRPTG